MLQKLLNKVSVLLFVGMAFIFTKLYMDIIRQDFVGRTVGNVCVRILCYIVAIVLHYVVYNLLNKKREFLKKHSKIILFIFLLLLFVIQLYLGNLMRIIPNYDFSSVYDGAVQWVVTGTFQDFYEYYYYYPNNLGAMFTFVMLFRMAANIGIQDFYMTAVVFNCVLCVVMIYALFQICKKKFSEVEACFALYLLAICPPMYLLGAVFYTDILTLFFPITIYYLYLCMEERGAMLQRKEGKKKTNIYLFCSSLIGIALLCLWGKLLKPTILIVLIAILISLILKRRFLLMLILVSTTIIVMTAGNSMFDHYIYNKHLDKEIAKKQNTPIETWILMGLNENTGFSPEDTEFSRSIEDPVLRKKEVQKAIIERVKNYGITGMYDLIKRKGLRAYGDGTFEFSGMFLLGMVNETKLTEYVTLLGKHYGTYWNYCSLLYYTNLFYMVVFLWSALWNYKKKGVQLTEEMVSPLAFLGLYLFLMIWEVHPRYTNNYFSILILLAVMGMSYLNVMIQGSKGHTFHVYMKKYDFRTHKNMRK